MLPVVSAATAMHTFSPAGPISVGHKKKGVEQGQDTLHCTMLRAGKTVATRLSHGAPSPPGTPVHPLPPFPFFPPPSLHFHRFLAVIVVQRGGGAGSATCMDEGTDGRLSWPLLSRRPLLLSPWSSSPSPSPPTLSLSTNDGITRLSHLSASPPSLLPSSHPQLSVNP